MLSTGRKITIYKIIKISHLALKIKNTNQIKSKSKLASSQTKTLLPTTLPKIYSSWILHPQIQISSLTYLSMIRIDNK